MANFNLTAQMLSGKNCPVAPRGCLPAYVNLRLTIFKVHAFCLFETDLVVLGPLNWRSQISFQNIEFDISKDAEL
jgi:hypothetical protein